MNVRQGLERISAVWWGLWGLLFAGLAVAGLIEDGELKLLFAGMGGIALVYAAHRVTCWVIAGFFAPQQP